jgi:cell division protein FtsB
MSTSTDRRRASSRGTAGTRTRPAPGTGTKRAPARPATASGSGSGTREHARTRGGRAPRIPFVLLVLSLLGGAIVGLLVLSGVVAEEAFTITSLQAQNRELSYEEQRLRESVAHLESSERIASEAEEMGMEPGEAPLFLDLDEGRVSGSVGSDD